MYVQVFVFLIRLVLISSLGAMGLIGSYAGLAVGSVGWEPAVPTAISTAQTLAPNGVKNSRWQYPGSVQSFEDTLT